jgi:hypothetical protein
MARWVSQSVLSSITQATRRRTEYLAPLVPEARRIIQEYLTESPTAEDVTLAVLEGLDRPLGALRKARGADRVNRDAGLWIAQTLVDVYGAANVTTLRGDDGRIVSTRRNTRAGLTSVQRYTPHRVRAPRGENADRILLDTIVISNILHAHEDAIDVNALKERAGSHRVSLADGALAELARALATRRLPIDLWARRVHLLDEVLDPQLPVGPGGADLFTIIGLRQQRGFDFEAMRAYYQGVWGYLRSRRTARDLERPGYYSDAAGRKHEVKLDAAHIESMFTDAAQKWADWVEGAGTEFAKLAGEGDKLDEEEMRRLVRLFLDVDLTSAALDKIDLGVRVIATRTREAGLNGHRPKGSNDALDFDLLLATALPAIVCTHDVRLVRLAQRTGSSEAWRVMEPRALLDWLATPRYEEALMSESSVEEQRAAWDAWVENGPQGPIEDEAVGWP